MYLQRYQNGDHVRVWQELRALEDQVRDPEYRDEVLAVARETMKRVRRNIELLIPRLLEIGYVFGYDHRLASPLRSIECIESRELYFQMKAWADQQPPVFLASHHQRECAEKSKKYEHEHPFGGVTEEEIQAPSPSDLALEEIEHQYGVFPLSVRVWYEEVGAVNFYGYHQQWAELIRSLSTPQNAFGHLMSDCDPLRLCALTEQVVQDIGNVLYWEPESPKFIFASDRHGKSYFSDSVSPYTIYLPNKHIDAIMGVPYPPPKGSRWFVDYLRVSILQWAGFPGMSEWPEVPKEHLEFLTRDLIPF